MPKSHAHAQNDDRDRLDHDLTHAMTSMTTQKAYNSNKWRKLRSLNLTIIYNNVCVYIKKS